MNILPRLLDPIPKNHDHVYYNQSSCIVVLGGSPHFSRQELLGSSGNIPHRTGEEKHEKTTVNLPNFDKASFRPASPPKFLHQILEVDLVNSQIGDGQATYFSKVRGVTIADF